MSGPGVVANAEFGPTGLRLHWPDDGPEARYIGSELQWADVRDIDVDLPPPEIRLRDGRTAFVAAAHREELAAAAQAADIGLVRRPTVWSHLLEPFLDTDYAMLRDRYERDLRRWGFAASEVAEIRGRFGQRMHRFALAVFEWVHLGQADLLRVCAPHEDPDFRAWTDLVADRPGRSMVR